MFRLGPFWVQYAPEIFTIGTGRFRISGSKGPPGFGERVDAVRVLRIGRWRLRLLTKQLPIA